MRFKLALVQCHHPEDGDVITLVDDYLAKAHDVGANIVVFPESLMTPYEMPAEQFFSASEELDGPFCSAINELAGKHELWVVYTANERNVDGDRPFNTAVVVDDRGEVRGSYRKTHLFDTDLTRESDKIMSGYEFFAPLETPFCKLGLGICYDLRFPELARAAALAECDVLVFPSAWVDGPGKVQQWKTLLSARAIENEMFVAGVSRCDRGFGEEARNYAGNSCVFDPLGNEVSAAGLSEGIVVAEIDTEEITRARAAMPVLGHRHVELYGSLLERNAQKYGVVLDEGGEPVEAYEGPLKYIFASYSHRDISIVYPILACLQRMGFRIWYDPGIQPGYEWEPFVMEHVDNCACCLFFSSASSLSSMYCQREVVAARKLDKDILVVNLDGSDFSWLAQYNLELLQHVFRSDFSNDGALTEAIAAADIVQPCKDTYEIVESIDEDGNRVATLTSYFGGSVEIVIPAGVTHIGETAFMAPNARKVVLPEGVVEIGDQAFVGCGSLESIVLPESLRTIKRQAFLRCVSLEQVQLGPNVESVFAGAFKDCTSLAKIDMLSTQLKEIARETFANCQLLTQVSLPRACNAISEKAFYNCRSLLEIDCPETVTRISNYAFAACESLEGIELHEGLSVIGGYAFGDCRMLRRANLPKTLRVIEACAFYKCEQLFVRVPKGVREIFAQAFFGCAGFSIEEGGPFREDSEIIYSSDGSVLISGSSASNVSSFVVPVGVKEIASSAFVRTTALRSVELSDSVEIIGKNAFAGCTSLGAIHFTKHVHNIGEGSFEGSGLREVVLPDTIDNLGNGAFAECKSLESVLMPDGIKELPVAVFSGCASLKSVSLPKSAIVIGDSAFSGCGSLTTLDLPDSVKEIGGRAFLGCVNLNLCMPASIEVLGREAFVGCKNVHTSSSDGNVVSNNRMLFKDHGKTLFCVLGVGVHSSHVVVPEGVEEISNYAFSFTGAEAKDYSWKLTIELPRTLQRIGTLAFDGLGLRERAIEITHPEVGTVSGKNRRPLHANGLFRERWKHLRGDASVVRDTQPMKTFGAFRYPDVSNG